MTLPFPLDNGFDPDQIAANANSFTWDGAVADFAVWDDPEFVQYTSHATNYPGDQFLGRLGPVYRLDLTTEELAMSGGVYVKLDRKWVVPNLLVAPRQLKPADFFVDQTGTRWTVLSAELPPRESCWDLVCRDPVIVYQLQDLVTVKTCTNTIDAAGVRQPTFTPSYVNVSARIQEIEGSTSDERGKRLTRQVFTVYLSQRVVVKQEDQLVDQVRGTIYEIKSYRNPDRIDQLMELTVEKRGW